MQAHHSSWNLSTNPLIRSNYGNFRNGWMTAHRLLAMGDSLTAGYFQDGRAFAPWAPLLQELLDSASTLCVEHYAADDDQAGDDVWTDANGNRRPMGSGTGTEPTGAPGTPLFSPY